MNLNIDAALAYALESVAVSCFRLADAQQAEKIARRKSHDRPKQTRPDTLPAIQRLRRRHRLHARVIDNLAAEIERVTGRPLPHCREYFLDTPSGGRMKAEAFGRVLADHLMPPPQTDEMLATLRPAAMPDIGTHAAEFRNTPSRRVGIITRVRNGVAWLDGLDGKPWRAGVAKLVQIPPHLYHEWEMDRAIRRELAAELAGILLGSYTNAIEFYRFPRRRWGVDRNKSAA